MFSKTDLTSGFWERVLGFLGLRNWVALKVENAQKPDEELYVKVNRNSLINRAKITEADLKAITENNILNPEKSSKLSTLLLKREVLDKVSADGNLLQKVSENFKKDYTVIHAAIQKNPEAIQHIASSTYTEMNGPQQREILGILSHASQEAQKQICTADRPWTPFLVQYLSPQALTNLTDSNPALLQKALSALVSTLMDQIKEIEKSNNPLKAIETPSNLGMRNYQEYYDADAISKLKCKDFADFLHRLEQEGQMNATPEIKVNYSAACLLLGRCYRLGIGAQKDNNEAFKWYKLAAEQGNMLAQQSLGFCYEKGIGTTQNNSKAFKWYQLGAKQGDANSQYNLARCYNQGIGVNKDNKEAFKWCKLAAEQGGANSQYALSKHYSLGVGVEQNHKEAFKWCKLAAEQGNMLAQHSLGFCYEKGIGTTQNNSKAFEWYQSGAKQGYANSQYNLARCYNQGIGVTKDNKEAFKWCKLAAQQRNAAAQGFLGDCYLNGIGIEKNDKEAIKWYRLAVGQGNANAQCALGWCYRYGRGVEKNEKKALKWLKSAADKGNTLAQKYLT